MYEAGSLPGEEGSQSTVKAWEPNPGLIATDSDYDEVLFCFLTASNIAQI